MDKESCHEHSCKGSYVNIGFHFSEIMLKHAILGYNIVKVLVSQLCLTFTTPWTVAHQVPLSIDFLEQEY